MFESTVGLLDRDWLPPLEEIPDWLDVPFDEADAWTDADALASAAARPTGVGLLMDLLSIDPAALTADEAVTFAQQVDRVAAFVAGVQAKARAEVTARLVAHFAESPSGGAERAARASGFVTAEMLASAELAAALRISPRSMDYQLDHAADLDEAMLPLREALLAGTVSPAHATAIGRELARLPLAADADRHDQYVAQCARILAIVVPYAAGHTAWQAARKTKTLVLAADPKGAADRRRDAAEREHGVWLTPTEAGSCELTAILPLAHGHAVMDAITTLAKDPRFETADGCLTKGQRKVAALVTLTLGDPGSVAVVTGPVAEAKVTAHVNVLVPMDVLTGANDSLGQIADQPATADEIRDLLTDAAPGSTLRRLVTDRGGCIIDAGRTRYAISDTQRHLIALRDGTCRFPGCRRDAIHCEIDHATPYNRGGPTDLCNLGPLCKHHHQLKTHGGWHIITSRPNGTCTWQSPLGRIYQHEPPGLLQPGDANPPPF